MWLLWSAESRLRPSQQSGKRIWRTRRRCSSVEPATLSMPWHIQATASVGRGPVAGAAGDHPQAGREGLDGRGVPVRAASVVDQRGQGRDGGAVLVQHRDPVGGTVGGGAARGGPARGATARSMSRWSSGCRRTGADAIPGHVRVDDRVVRGDVAGVAPDVEGREPAASGAAGVPWASRARWRRSRRSGRSRDRPGLRRDAGPRRYGGRRWRRRR